MYEIFTRKVSRSGTPMMSFSKLGQIVFNTSAAQQLQKAAIDHVLLMWDTEERKMAVKSTSNKKDTRAYHIRYADKGNGASFSAKTFLDYIGVDYAQRKGMAVEINQNHEIVVEVKIPDDYFKRKSQPRIVSRTAAASSDK
ncbi:MAG: hypothetical protein ABSG11_24435 [Candidatus Korobacteraceae bacterium]|jgi:anti-sigma factor ChrR (cupin superfamily)